jgi:HPt (histidine-containing phosphotransfer) domain-containing protein
MRATPYRALAIGLAEAELERARRALESELALWVDRATTMEEARSRIEARHDAVLAGLRIAESLPGVARALRSLGEGRDRPLPALVVVAGSPVPDGRPLPSGISACTAAPLRTDALRDLLSRVEDPPIPYRSDDRMSDFAGEYLANRRADVQAMEVDLAAKDGHAVAERAHRFKGTGAVYGFPQISDAGAQIERAARADAVAEARTCIRALALHLDELAREAENQERSA